MLYLSKGIVCKNSTADNLYIARGNTVLALNGMEADIWLKGRFHMISYPDTQDIEKSIFSLNEKGLGEYEYNSNAVGQYRILSRCICYPAKSSVLKKRLSKSERIILEWITKAGIRLTTAELVFLQENEISPVPSLLYEENRQSLIETIYTKNTIYDNLLEHQMEHSYCRDEVVAALLLLLRKKRIVML